jgi:hypothetical protein
MAKNIYLQFENDKVVLISVVLELDSILDKIGQYGINNITKEEKDFLDNLN